MRVRFRVMVVGWTALAGVGCVHRATDGGWSVSTPDIPLPKAAATVQAPPPGATQELPGKESASLCLSMAEGLEKENKFADAVVYYERARSLDPAVNDRAARRLAVLYDRLDQQAVAMKEFQELLKKKPKDAALLNDVGYSYYNRGQWAEAETYLRKAIAADKAYKQAWVNLGMALAMQGKYQEGVEAFEKGVSKAEAQANLGFILVVQGKKAEAAVAYRRALEFEPTYQAARQALSKLEAGESPGQLPPVGPTAPVQPAAALLPGS